MSNVERRGDVRRYHSGRFWLIGLMGGKCAVCGGEIDLEFHHRFPHTFQARKKARWQRLAHYRRQFVLGRMELRCRSCNASAGKPRPKKHLGVNDNSLA